MDTPMVTLIQKEVDNNVLNKRSGTLAMQQTAWILSATEVLVKNYGWHTVRQMEHSRETGGLDKD